MREILASHRKTPQHRPAGNGIYLVLIAAKRQPRSGGLKVKVEQGAEVVCDSCDL